MKKDRNIINKKKYQKINSYHNREQYFWLPKFVLSPPKNQNKIECGKMYKTFPKKDIKKNITKDILRIVLILENDFE